MAGKKMITTHFSFDELCCPTTKEASFQEGFLTLLEELRVAYDSPLKVNSCCRSYEHNKALQEAGSPAVDGSFHLMGNKKYGTDTLAIDFAMTDSAKRFRLIHLATERSWTVGVAKTFLHLDARNKLLNLPAIIYLY